MAKFLEKLEDTDKEKYIKDIKKSINLEKYPKVQDFICNNSLYITNVKTGPISIKEKNLITVLDNSQDRWFILCLDGKITLLAKKNTIIHTEQIDYLKRDASFSKKNTIKKADYYIEYMENIGANLSLNVKNYNGFISKEKWKNETEEIPRMTLQLQNNHSLMGYTYNGKDFSLCSIGKNSTTKQNAILA